jgi:DNA-binding NarL/FixJ family response regulator
MKNKITIYIADDHQIIIDGLSLLLKNEENILMIGSAIDGQRASESIHELQPDIALIDLRMPNKDGLQIIRSLYGKITTKFIILSMHHDKRYITDAMNYGAQGYLFKNIGREELIKSINEVMRGNKCFPNLRIFYDDQKNEFLTPRELDILKLVINEFTSQQIAENLSLSQYTVDTHRKNILRKTGAKNLIGLVKYAMDNNISFND